jgi:asparagine synthase (glutamine-hydrolysing)
MCGIAGYFNLRERTNPGDAKAIVLDQIESLEHRGPDAQDAYVGPGVGLGHARLSIIDLSSAANQPMFDDSGKIGIVFNGEIYNFQEIRTELETKGHHFRTNSDTEVIIAGYIEWGTDVVDRLRGMFGLAIYDGKKDRLILLRDRVGKKPLYYMVRNGVLIFASEIKGILRYPGVERRPNYDAIHEYLTFQYVPAPLSGFVGIHKLPPAHLLIASRNKEPVVRRYYSWPRPSAVRPRRIEELREELVAHLKESTRLRMISDVPIGAFLSGGVDSSSVVAMMASCSDRPVKTFTIGFEEQAYDEREFARAVAKRYGTDHHEMTVRPDGMSVIDHIVYHYGEPYADSSAIPTYYVSQVAREHVTVVLNGDGGDESFLGYPRYAWCRQQFDKDTSRLPRPLARRLQNLILGLPEGLDRIDVVSRARKAASLIYERRSRRYEIPIANISDDAKKSLYADSMQGYLARSALDRLDDYFDQAQSMAHGAAWTDLHTYLPDDLMVKVDVASMAHSLEARSPLLDHKLMEWAATIPEEIRFQGNETKSLFKQAMEPYLPHDLMYRPKMGFGVPVDIWLRNDMREFAYDVLLDETARERGLFDMKYVRSILDAHSSGQNWAIRIWCLLMLELWFRMWIDGVGTVALPTKRDVIHVDSTSLRATA